jgi:hypothetical protein
MINLLKNEELETLFRVEASFRNEQNHWFYGKEISSLLNQGFLAEFNGSLQITPKGTAQLIIARNGELEDHPQPSAISHSYLDFPGTRCPDEAKRNPGTEAGPNVIRPDQNGPRSSP